MKSPTVIIAAYNEEKTIEKTLSSIQNQGAEVIVVASGNDKTKEKAEEHPATDKVLKDKKESGAGAARNQGARNASEEILLFTDADTEVPSDWVKKHVRHYKKESVVGVGGPLKPLQKTIRHKVLFKILSDWWYRVSWVFGFVQLSGSNCSYRKKDFLKEKGFNEEISFMEDTELSLRMKKHGKIVYDKEAWVKTSARR